jgi:hypothetical protein
MEATMPKSHYSVTDAVRDAARLVDDAITNIRNRGYTREQAIAQVAERFGLPATRVKKLAYGEAYSITEDEYISIIDNFLKHLENEEEFLAAGSRAARERRAKMEVERGANAGWGMDYLRGTQSGSGLDR